jgi:nitrogen regulatory protein P-II 1
VITLIVAIVKPHRLGAVMGALQTAGVHGMTASEVQGYGRQGGKTEAFRGSEYRIDFVPKVKVEVVVETERAEAVVEAIADAGRTGKIGDGKIWALPLSSVLRIRTGEAGTDAI